MPVEYHDSAGHLAQIDPTDPFTFSAMLDSGAGLHTCPAESGIPRNLTPSSMKAKLADHSLVQATSKGSVTRTYNGHNDGPMTVHRIPNTRWLQSIPLLLEKGHHFWLTNSGRSYEFMAGEGGTMVAVPIGRTSHNPDGTSAGYLVNRYRHEGDHAVQLPVPGDNGRSTETMRTALGHLACLPDEPASDHGLGAAVSVAPILPYKGRFRATTSSAGIPDAKILHDRLNHPSKERLMKWSRVALGFPCPDAPSTKSLIDSAAGCSTSCDTCHVAKDSRNPVPHVSPAGRTHARGATWSIDFTRTFEIPTPEGATVALVCMERVTRYVKAYLLTDHTDLWEALQLLVDWCATRVGAEIRELQGDCDVMWASGPVHRPTAQCLDFQVENQLFFSRSPPYTQSMNTIEGSIMGPLLGGMYASMAHARVGAAMWGDALLHNADVMNMGPLPGKTVPPDLLHRPISDSGTDPRLDYSPQGALLGTLPDISLLTVPLFATAWVLNPKSKASQLRPKSRIGIFVGIAEHTLGFKVRLLSDFSFVSSLHVRFDPQLGNRPLALARRHGLLTGDGGRDTNDALPDALEALYEHPFAKDDSAIVMYDLFTNLPTRLVPSADPEYGLTLTEVSRHDETADPLVGRRIRSTLADGELRDATVTGTHSGAGDGTVVSLSYDGGGSTTLRLQDLLTGTGAPGHVLLPAETTSDRFNDLSATPTVPANPTFATNTTARSTRQPRPPRRQLLAKAREAPTPGGGRRVIGRDNSSMSGQGGGGTAKLSYNMSNKIKKLPGQTKIRFQQHNPKRGESRIRYEKYKSATDVDSFLHLGGRRADLLNDLERGFMNVPHLQAISHIVSPTLCLAAIADTNLLCHDRGTPLATQLSEADRHHDIMSIAGNPGAPNRTCPSLSEPWGPQPDGVQPSSGTTHDAWAYCRLSQNDETWTCALGIANDLADALAHRINAITKTYPGPDIIDRHLKDLQIPRSSKGMPRKIAQLGHREETAPDPVDTIINDAIARWDGHLYDIAALAATTTSLARPSNSPTTTIPHSRMPPPGKTPPSAVEPGKGDPANVREMMSDPLWASKGGWRDKYLDEVLQVLDTYKVLVPATTHDYVKEREALYREGKGRKAVIIPTTVVATRKFHADGTFHRLKVRLCAAQNRKRFDMGDSWSPTVGLDSVRFILTIASLTKSHLSTYDVSGAYLNGKRSPDDDVIYLRAPPGIQHLNESLKARGMPPDPRLKPKDSHGNTVLFRCPGNLYGLQQAGRIWYLCAREWLLGPSMRMAQSNVDPCIFYRRFPDSAFIILALYVDDSLQVMSNSTVSAWFAAEFTKRFNQSPGSGGNIHDFLGMTITQSEDRRVLRVNCPKLWMKLRERLDRTTLPNAKAPLPGNAMEEVYAEPSEENPILTEDECDVRGILGQVAWGIQACRPGEVFSSSLLARRAHIPTRRYCRMLLHMCAYCLDHAGDDMVIGALSREKSFHCHVDSSWANDPATNRSWFGYSLRWAGAAFCTRAKLQPIVALSSRDAESIGCVFAVKAMLGFIIMLQELGFTPSQPLHIAVDNKATVDGAHSDKISKDSRHQAMRLAWLRDVVRSEIISMTHVSTGKNDADIHTKILAGPAHRRIRAALMGHAPAGTAQEDD